MVNKICCVISLYYKVDIREQVLAVKLSTGSSPILIQPGDLQGGTQRPLVCLTITIAPGATAAPLALPGQARLTQHQPSTPPLPPHHLIITLVQSCCRTEGKEKTSLESLTIRQFLRSWSIKPFPIGFTNQTAKSFITNQSLQSN